MNARLRTWLSVALGAFGLLFAAVLGLWVYVSATATPLHPRVEDIPATSHAASASRWATAVERARQAVRTHLAEHNLPGLSVAVGATDAIAWAEGFGWADLERREPVTPATKFRIGTASTALTSAAVGLLLEQGRLHLDEVIQSRAPQYPEKPWPVTLRTLMGHTAGVRNDGGDEGPLLSLHCAAPVDALPHFADRPLLFEPETEFRYSSYGWILVSAAVEAASGEAFDRWMRKQVFEPLGMDDTRADSATEAIADRATPYFPRFAADPRYGPDPMRPVDHSCYAGSSAFLSTPSDLVRFAMGIRGGRLLQPATVALLQSSQRLRSGEATGYGLGWDLETVTLGGQPTNIVGHNGDVLGGMAASFMTVPATGITVAVTSNISYADTFALAQRIAEAFAEPPSHTETSSPR